MRGHITDHCFFLKVQDHTAAGTGTITSDAVDMAQGGGFESVCFLTSFGTAAAGNLIKAQQSSDDAATDTYDDLTGTSVSSNTSDEDVWLDIQRPTKRYLKLIVTRGTSSTTESIWAILYNGRNKPVTGNVLTGTITGEKHVSEPEGTA